MSKNKYTERENVYPIPQEIPSICVNYRISKSDEGLDGSCTPLRRAEPSTESFTLQSAEILILFMQTAVERCVLQNGDNLKMHNFEEPGP